MDKRRIHRVALALVRSLPETGRSVVDIERAACEWRWRQLAVAALRAVDAMDDERPETRNKRRISPDECRDCCMDASPGDQLCAEHRIIISEDDGQ